MSDPLDYLPAHIRALVLVLRKLKLTVLFDGAFICEKAIYLAQESGIELGYRFYWYTCGPKSDDLLDDLKDVKQFEEQLLKAGEK